MVAVGAATLVPSSTATNPANGWAAFCSVTAKSLFPYVQFRATCHVNKGFAPVPTTAT